MSFTGLMYDECAFRSDIKSSMGPGAYVISTPLQECDQIFPTNPYIRNSSRPAASYSPHWVDINSDLTGLIRPLTNCPERMYQKDSKCSFEQSIMIPKDSDILFTEDTKISNPPCTLKEKGINRWWWLPEDPQERTLTEFENTIRFGGVQNRIVVKDNHRPIMPTPLDPSKSLPAMENMNVEVRYVKNPEMTNMSWTKVNDRIVTNSGRTCSEIQKM